MVLGLESKNSAGSHFNVEFDKTPRELGGEVNGRAKPEIQEGRHRLSNTNSRSRSKKEAERTAEGHP